MLKPRKKLTKREIKEDTLVTTYLRIQKYYQKYQKVIQYTLAGVVVVVVIGVLMIRSKKNTENVALRKLSMAEQYFYMANINQAIESLTEIIETYSGTKASGDAAFLLANIYFQNREYGQAEKYYRLVYEKYDNKGLIASSSLAGIAACLESKNEFDEAAIMYEKAGQKSKNNFDAPFHLKNAARCYMLAGQQEKGKRLYQYILDYYSESSLKSEIEFVLQSL
jgi:tetratricopeptide (TPR) repeat protein